MKRYFINKHLNADISKKQPNERFWKPKIYEYVQMIRSHIPPRQEFTDGGLYVGSPGVAYLFYTLMKSPMMEAERKVNASKGLEYICTAGQYFSGRRVNDIADMYGFLLGRAGYHAVACAFYWNTGSKSKAEEQLQQYINLHQYSNYNVAYGGNELFVGRAGYLLGAIWLQKQISRPVLSTEQMNEICELIVSDGRTFARSQQSESPLMYAYYNTEYLGAAHGLSAILLALMACDDFLNKNPGAEKDIKTSIDYLLSTQTRNGNFPCATHDIGKVLRPDCDQELVHWCHGAPGIVYTMAKAYLRWNEDKYLQSCIRAGEVVWERGLLKKGPGICHGVAGNGYVFLLLYRLTRDEKYLQRATVFAEFMTTSEFRKEAHTPDSPYSLYEGLSGTLCFLADLHCPDQAAFPFMDVF